MSKKENMVNTLVVRNGRYRHVLADMKNLERLAKTVEEMRGRGQEPVVYMESEDDPMVVDDVLPEVEVIFNHKDISRRN